MCARQCPNIPPRIDLLGGSCQLSSLGRELVLLDIILHSSFDILRPILSTCSVWELALSKIPRRDYQSLSNEQVNEEKKKNIIKDGRSTDWLKPHSTLYREILDIYLYISMMQ